MLNRGFDFFQAIQQLTFHTTSRTPVYVLDFLILPNMFLATFSRHLSSSEVYALIYSQHTAGR